MAVQDLDLLTAIQTVLQEDATFSNGLWSLAEVLGYANQRQYRFLKETGIIAAQAIVPWVPGTPLQPLPPDWIETLDVLWHDFSSGAWYPLPRSDQFELDHVDANFATTTGPPQAYRDGETPTVTIGVGPAPAAPGELDLLYVALSDLLDGTGIYCNLPDEWTPYLLYGVYSDMLGKDGRGQDLLRARYAEVRWNEGITLAKALLEGW